MKDSNNTLRIYKIEFYTLKLYSKSSLLIS